MKKRFVALVLAMFMIAGAFALPVAAAESIEDSGPDIVEYVEIAPLLDIFGLIGTRPRCGG